MTIFVLVPGAWLGRWAWSAVEADLVDSGHDVHAITLAGLAERADEDDARIGLATHIDDVTTLIEERSLQDVVLVGHSYAGAVVSGVAERVPDRIARLIYVAGAVLPNETSLFDLLGPEAAAGMQAMAIAAGDPDRLPVPGDPELAMYYGDHGLENDLLKQFRTLATPHPLGTFREAIAIGNPRAAGLPRTFIRATADWPSPIGPDTPGWEYAEVVTGHWPMLTKPSELVGLLGVGRAASSSTVAHA